ncbi:hypothetical protein H5410_030705 [Solanum commersonii]|uniref:NADH dehydrogenase subunit 2 n=1 Tax=Solanum commersonii TaxID=4109 RepID=A0A9J5YHQ3_SOLCO|nr:hypothetical protein H5410_030705 [Solanum commersonii]
MVLFLNLVAFKIMQDYTQNNLLALSLALCLLSLKCLPPLAIINDWTKVRNNPHMQTNRRSPIRSNNSIELNMIVCVITSTIPGISMNPIIAISQDSLF